MPELPEVETVKRGLQPVMEGARIDAVRLNRDGLRFPFPDRFADRLLGRTVISLSRRAKYMLADIDNGEVLVMHLGMSGSFRIHACNGLTQVPGEFHHPRSADTTHDHVVLALRGALDADIVYNDPRRFGFMTLVARASLGEHPLFAGLGVEPVGNALDGKMLQSLFGGRRQPVKTALMDQKLIAGIGNIYACEALWMARIRPQRLAGDLKAAEANRLATAIRTVLDAAIAAGGSSLRDHRQADGSLGYFQHSFNVYDREGEACLRPGCGGTVCRIVQGGRSAFYCETCQD